MSYGGIFAYSNVNAIVPSWAHLQIFTPLGHASDLMQRQIARGSDGIDEIIKSLSQVDSEEAKAWKMEDGIKVKLIRPMR